MTSHVGWTVAPSSVAKLCSPRSPADGHVNPIPNGHRPTGERLLTSSVHGRAGWSDSSGTCGRPKAEPEAKAWATRCAQGSLSPLARTPPLRGPELPSWEEKAGPFLSPGSTVPPHLASNSALEVHRLRDYGLSSLGQVDPKPRTLSTTLSQVGWERRPFPTEVASAHLPTPLTLTIRADVRN